jgi:glucosamine-6-phosphate deaminase
MARPVSVVAPEWWDYTTLDKELIEDAANLTPEDVLGLSRPGFEVRFYDTLESFYLAEALEYIEAWQQASADLPTGICGPIGPTEQLPLVAQLVNELELRMPEANLHFPKVDTLDAYRQAFDDVKCLAMQGGQGDVKHWAFNDPPKREEPYADDPPPPEEYLKLGARVVDLHPMTVIQNARTSVGGKVSEVPTQALTVGPRETWKAERVSIWQPGAHDNPFGMRLTALMIAKKIADAAVPMSLLALHPNVRFSFYRHGIGTCEAEMH